MTTNKKIADVPWEFQQLDRYPYPENNSPDFEFWFMKNVKEDEIGDRVYLPILFTSYWKLNKYGEDKKAIDRLQKFIDSLDRSKKYFCLVQYDHGCLIDWKDLDVFIFGSGCRGDAQFSLSGQPHKFDFSGVEKDILCSFVGRITHPIREKIMGLKGLDGYYISDKHHNFYEYQRIMARSKFVITPRGVGFSCFKIAEAIQNLAIPIYASDEENWLIPHGGNFSYGILVSGSAVLAIPSIVNKLQDVLHNMQVGLPDIYKYFYSFQGNKDRILEKLRQIS